MQCKKFRPFEPQFSEFQNFFSPIRTPVFRSPFTRFQIWNTNYTLGEQWQIRNSEKMIAQHRKKECCTSEEGKLKNKIMFAEILFFLPLCKPAKLFLEFQNFFFTHSHTSFQITVYKVSTLENKLIQWENTDKFETLKNCLRNTVKNFFAVLKKEISKTT